jgi:ribosomal protein L11 methyltransferase
MDIYFSYTIQCTDEALLGLLTQFDFESFEENEDHIVGYINESFHTNETKVDIQSVISKFTTDFQVDQILPQNWNAIWEESFQPVIVEEFCQIRADFHPANLNIKYDLVINPKMAFGTGHHATTYMMIKSMEGIDFKDKNVFDFGCGTGILAILASKLGAKDIDAIDIEEESYLNTIENSQINGVTNVTSMLGDMSDVPDRQYDIILANINRNILIRYSGDIIHKMKVNSILLLSGVLKEDISLVLDEYNQKGLSTVHSIEKDGWMCAMLNK